MSTATYDAATHELIPKAEATQIRENAKAAAAIRFKYENYCADAAPAATRRAELQTLHDEAASGNSVLQLNLRLVEQHDALVTTENLKLKAEQMQLRAEFDVLVNEAEQLREATARTAVAREKREEEHHKQIAKIQSALDACTASCRAMKEENQEIASTG